MNEINRRIENRKESLIAKIEIKESLRKEIENRGVSSLLIDEYENAIDNVRVIHDKISDLKEKLKDDTN